MDRFNRRAMLNGAPAAVVVAAIAASSTIAQGSPGSDKSLGITRLPSTNNFNSLAVRHGNVVYTGGVQATDFTQDFVGQSMQAFARIDAALATFGSSKENLLSVTIRTKNIAGKPAFNKAWVEWLGSAGLPARVYAVVADLDARVSDRDPSHDSLFAGLSFFPLQRTIEETGLRCPCPFRVLAV